MTDVVVEVVDDDENEIVDGEDDDYDGDNGVGVGEDERGGVGVRWGSGVGFINKNVPQKQWVLNYDTHITM